MINRNRRKCFLYNHYEKSELSECLREENVKKDIVDVLANDLYNKLYEVQLEVFYDDEGKVMDIEINDDFAQKIRKSYEQKIKTLIE